MKKKLCKRCKKIIIRRNLWTLAIAALFLAIFSILLNQTPIFDKPIRAAVSVCMAEVSDNWVNDSYVDSIYNICELKNTDEEKIICVYKIINLFLDYNLNQTDTFSTPKEILKEGGVCRHYSLLYKSIYDKMGYNTEYIQEPEHVYVKVYLENVTYTIDQTLISIEKDLNKSNNLN